MKKHILYFTLFLTITNCSSKKMREEQILKEQSINTVLKNEEPLGHENALGVDSKGNVMHMSRTQLAEYLQSLKYDTLKEYEALYGIREYSSKGLAGKLDSCNIKASQKKNGGDGIPVKLTERSDVLNTELMSEWKNFNNKKKSYDTNAKTDVGFDEKGQLTAVTSENLMETIDRFQDYRKNLSQKRIEIEQLLANCEAKIEAASK